MSERRQIFDRLTSLDSRVGIYFETVRRAFEGKVLSNRCLTRCPANSDRKQRRFREKSVACCNQRYQHEERIRGSPLPTIATSVWRLDRCVMR